jgi:hypothetical protein
MSPAGILGLIIDAALGGLQIANGFAEFRKNRDPNETEAEAAAAYAKKMLEAVVKEDEADAAIADWLAKHGQP